MLSSWSLAVDDPSVVEAYKHQIVLCITQAADEISQVESSESFFTNYWVIENLLGYGMNGLRNQCVPSRFNSGLPRIVFENALPIETQFDPGQSTILGCHHSFCEIIKLITSTNEVVHS